VKSFIVAALTLTEDAVMSERKMNIVLACAFGITIGAIGGAGLALFTVAAMSVDEDGPLVDSPPLASKSKILPSVTESIYHVLSVIPYEKAPHKESPFPGARTNIITMIRRSWKKEDSSAKNTDALRGFS
jgi:hypothetical protein